MPCLDELRKVGSRSVQRIDAHGPRVFTHRDHDSQLAAEIEEPASIGEALDLEHQLRANLQAA
jgi:hypothetical protein